MSLQGINIGFAITGSHCTMDRMFVELENLKLAGAEIFPIISPAVRDTSTRYGEAKMLRERVEAITGKSIIEEIADAEPIGPQKLFDVITIMPCTGNTLAKLANGISDTAVLMAAKATLRNGSPVVLGISTNDALGLNGVNIMKLLNSKNIYFIPFGQDDPINKPNSLIADFSKMTETVEYVLKHKKQIQPLFIQYFK